MEMNKIVKKLSRNMGKTLSIADLSEIIDPTESGSARVRQCIYSLVGSGILTRIRRGLYLITDPESQIRTSDEGIDTNYWSIVSRIIAERVGFDAIIAGEKSLELWLMDASIPSELVVYTRSTNALYTVAPGYTLRCITAKTGKKSGSKNFFSVLHAESVVRDVSNCRFRVLNHTASLLDALVLHTHSVGVTEALVLKYLKRYEKMIDRDALGKLVSFRYIRPVNRLRAITKMHGYERIYQICLEVIKHEGGGCFLTL